MTRPPRPSSKRDRIPDEAAYFLRSADGPTHVSLIASAVLARLGLADEVKVKDVNTALHDDPQRRFVRVDAGTWVLSKTPRLL